MQEIYRVPLGGIKWKNTGSIIDYILIKLQQLSTHRHVNFILPNLHINVNPSNLPFGPSMIQNLSLNIKIQTDPLGFKNRRNKQQHLRICGSLNPHRLFQNMILKVLEKSPQVISASATSLCTVFSKFSTVGKGKYPP